MSFGSGRFSWSKGSGIGWNIVVLCWNEVSDDWEYYGKLCHLIRITVYFWIIYEKEMKEMFIKFFEQLNLCRLNAFLLPRFPIAWYANMVFEWYRMETKKMIKGVAMANATDDWPKFYLRIPHNLPIVQYVWFYKRKWNMRHNKHHRE